MLAKVRNDASALKSQAQLTFQTAEKKLLTAQAEYGAAAQAHEADKDDQAANQRFLDASAALREAEQEYSKAKIDLDTALGNEIALIQESEAQVKETQAALETLRKLPDPFAVKEAQRAVQQAELALAQARTQAVADPELQIRLEEAQKALDTINAQFEARRLYAPFDGEIVEINAKAGALLQPGDPVVTILNPDIPADAREIQLAQVDPSVNISQGQAVSVVLADSGDKLVPGTVSRILGDAASGSRVAYVTLEAAGLSLAPGAPAMVALELSRRAATLWLPPPAIRNDGRSFVMVMDAGKQSRVNIDLGITGLGRVEILNGLSEGQVVVGQ
jgi:HlyD family secretion protein